ncbi:hypothetical protein H3S80_01760 [Bartonella sp. M0177]|uniref:hypothetical protein n=1 Tax=Bartonella sp. M0177 TaxID=2750940 RepID=UPI0018DB82EE|nr:hypothetical protein [Bartonella sp. M0177]MBI0002778.1 hypothetical protein [Bartonella sp. M0177]
MEYNTIPPVSATGTQQERLSKTIKPDANLSDANMATNWLERTGLMLRIDGGSEAIDLGMMEGVVL